MIDLLSSSPNIAALMISLLACVLTVLTNALVDGEPLTEREQGTFFLLLLINALQAWSSRSIGGSR